ncbi:MAG TPA: T9SS type A sorting domain-containing protein, partial [Prolixibacteraceae bacterium]|nr:T9SS type A sorting domain-containing protein [Prolixibacteraceae bacterium]
LETQVHDEKEYLVYTGDSVLISVYGRSTDSLVVEYDGADSNLFWDSIIQNIEYRNISDAPVADSVREINIVVNDGFSYSLGALTFVTMIPENDAPVSLRSPSLSSLPQYNHYLSEIEHGIWSDTLDNISDVEFEYTYTMEADMGDTIISIASPADSFFVDERFCGSCLRVVETVIDKSSGGENEANAKAYSNWYDVRKIEQEVIEFYLEDSYEIIPKVEYRHEPYRFSGSATSGLPLRYGIFNDDFFSITNDSLSVKDIGMEPVYAYQPGNNCYSKTDSLYKNINVVKGSQQILADMDSVYHFGVDSFKVNVSVASGLNVFVESMDTSIIKISNQHAIVMGTGQCFLRFTQPGNKYYKAADTLRYLINVNKGNQFINAPDSIVKNYNDSLFDLSVTANSNLKVDYVVPENEVLSYQDQQFKITGTGVTNIIINQEGNENWEATSDTVHCVIKKGLQEILFDSIEFVFYDDEMLLLDAESTSGLEVTYEVSDNDIADIHGDTLLIRAAGELTVNASQAGNEFWMPATLVSRELNIQKAGQTITTTLSDSITTRQKISYGDFHASSGLTDFVIESSNDDVILVLEDSIIVNDRGRITLHVTQPGNNNYLPASEDFVFEVLYPLNVEKFGTHTLDLFPNPADDKLHIVIDGNILLPLDFSLINLVGQVQMTDKIINQFQVVDIENIESGTYIVLLRNDDHYLTQKIIVK